jgi:kynurenine formamidase
MTIIDLSVPLNKQTPTYDGDPPTKIALGASVAKDGYADSYISTYSHTGTHIDAPAHMLADGSKTLDAYPIDHFVGRGRYIDVTNKTFDLAAVQQAGVQAGDIVLFHTGMSDAYHEPSYYNENPAVTEGIANYLVQQGVKMVGVDMCSVDHEPFPVHKVLLAANVLIIENLTNLGTLAGKTLDVYALPVRLDIDGAPARVIAQLNEAPHE